MKMPHEYRKFYQFDCLICGKTSIKRDPRARFCSGKCRQQHKRDKAKELTA